MSVELFRVRARWAGRVWYGVCRRQNAEALKVPATVLTFGEALDDCIEVEWQGATFWQMQLLSLDFELSVFRF